MRIKIQICSITDIIWNELQDHIDILRNTSNEKHATYYL